MTDPLSAQSDSHLAKLGSREDADRCFEWGRLGWDRAQDLYDVVRTLRAYIAAPEGDGPLRYSEALDLADAALGIASDEERNS